MCSTLITRFTRATGHSGRRRRNRSSTASSPSSLAIRTRRLAGRNRWCIRGETGRLYREQWQRAIALHPELILIYSWNEYFERTAIEPTDAWGNQYLQMTACYIQHAHRGTPGTC